MNINKGPGGGGMGICTTHVCVVCVRGHFLDNVEVMTSDLFFFSKSKSTESKISNSVIKLNLTFYCMVVINDNCVVVIDWV